MPSGDFPSDQGPRDSRLRHSGGPGWSCLFCRTLQTGLASPAFITQGSLFAPPSITDTKWRIMIVNGGIRSLQSFSTKLKDLQIE